MTATTPTTDVAAFVLARLQEDEAAARAADVPPNGVGDFRSRCYENLGGWPVAMADHVERHDPARVLAQVAALRQVVEMHGGSAYCEMCGDGQYSSPCPTLRALASMWADAPGYGRWGE